MTEQKQTYDILDNEILIDTYREILKQLSDLAPILGKSLIKFSKLRNEYVIVLNELGKRLKNKVIDTNAFNEEIAEILTSSLKIQKQIEQMITIKDEAKNEKHKSQ